MLRRLDELANITPTSVRHGLNKQQRGAPQLPAEFQPGQISVLANRSDPEHPARKFFVGAESKNADIKDTGETYFVALVTRDAVPRVQRSREAMSFNQARALVQRLAHSTKFSRKPFVTMYPQGEGRPSAKELLTQYQNLAEDIESTDVSNQTQSSMPGNGSSILKEYDTTMVSVVQKLPKGLNINNFFMLAFKEFLYQKYSAKLKSGWDSLWPWFRKEYNEKHGIKEYKVPKPDPNQVMAGDADFFDDMLLVVPRGLDVNQLYQQGFKEFLYKKFGNKEWPEFKKNRDTYWAAYQKYNDNQPQGFFNKLKSKVGLEEAGINEFMASTNEDVLSNIKKRLGDYLEDVAKAIRQGDVLGDKVSAQDSLAMVKTITTDDGKVIQIRGNADDGFRISVKDKVSETVFRSLREAETAIQLYNSRRSTTSPDYKEESK